MKPEPGDKAKIKSRIARTSRKSRPYPLASVQEVINGIFCWECKMDEKKKVLEWYDAYDISPIAKFRCEMIGVGLGLRFESRSMTVSLSIPASNIFAFVRQIAVDKQMEIGLEARNDWIALSIELAVRDAMHLDAAALSALKTRLLRLWHASAMLSRSIPDIMKSNT